MPPEQPIAIVLADINGAGKTTAFQRLLAERLAVMCFVNADMIARGLNAIAPETAALQAGRVMLQRLRELREERADFAFETTLAGKTCLSFLRNLRQDGYVIELYYFWLDSPELAVERVRTRVASGGHDIPEGTIRQRYGRSLENFWTGYRHEADSRFDYDNSIFAPVLLAAGHRGDEPLVAQADSWSHFQKAVDDA
ncbi:MAG TPA: zeta toxin family protein [Gemmataceae bacterium]|jgi:predicted ABC-type ATPase|nr:zeta toxin family protein [Gemmataceae bacterium]